MEIRAFIAAYPSTEALDNILAFRREFQSMMPRNGVRWAKEEQLHLTLRFFEALPVDLVSPLVESLTESLASCPSIPMKASFVGPLWDRCKVLGLMIDGQDLSFLAKLVNDEAINQGLLADNKEFKAHLTLARLEDHRLQPRMPNRTIAEWTVDAIYFVKSELQQRGAKHTILAKVPLGSGGS